MWFRPLPIGVAGAALAIAVVVYFGNAGGRAAGELPGPRRRRPRPWRCGRDGELAALTPTGTGRSYADLGFVDDTGRPMTLKDFAGRPLLVNFWATWCVPCREEMPALNALAAGYTDDVFSVVPVNLDTGGDAMDKVRTFLEDEKLSNLPLLNDSTFSAFDRLKATGVALGLPSTVLVDADGLRDRHPAGAGRMEFGRRPQGRRQAYRGRLAQKLSRTAMRKANARQADLSTAPPWPGGGTLLTASVQHLDQIEVLLVLLLDHRDRDLLAGGALFGCHDRGGKSDVHKSSRSENTPEIGPIILGLKH